MHVRATKIWWCLLHCYSLCWDVLWGYQFAQSGPALPSTADRRREQRQEKRTHQVLQGKRTLSCVPLWFNQSDTHFSTIPSPPPSTTLLCIQLTNTKHSWQHGTRCRDGANVLWCRPHLVCWLVFHPYIYMLSSFGKLFCDLY